jgi:tyrosyl-tRNA synthetase
LVSSNGEARRLIKNNGAKVNDTAVHDEYLKLGPDDVSADGLIKLSSGRKRHVLLRVA